MAKPLQKSATAREGTVSSRRTSSVQGKSRNPRFRPSLIVGGRILEFTGLRCMAAGLATTGSTSPLIRCCTIRPGCGRPGFSPAASSSTIPWSKPCSGCNGDSSTTTPSAITSPTSFCGNILSSLLLWQLLSKLRPAAGLAGRTPFRVAPGAGRIGRVDFGTQEHALAASLPPRDVRLDRLRGK